MPAKNRLIQLLPPRERARVLSLCEPVRLTLSDTLYQPDTPTRHVYFPTSGFISLVAIIDGASALEVGMIGREGMLGVHVALGVATSPLRSLVQGPGEAWRMSAPRFRSELASNSVLRRHITRYVAVLMSQLASSAACVRYHRIGPRLARWLLMSQDRAVADQFNVTQEFLSYMLGVRRVGVTSAAGALQRDGLIAYRRGQVTVLDRPGLEAAACSCYASDRTASASLVDRT